MITCQKCGRDNQDHYKFCLGCGAELPREKQRMLSQPPPAAAPAAVEKVDAPPGPAAQPPPPAGGSNPPTGAVPQAAPADAPCPQCGEVNPARNRFCASCGYRLGGAPKPAVQDEETMLPSGGAQPSPEIAAAGDAVPAVPGLGGDIPPASQPIPAPVAASPEAAAEPPAPAPAAPAVVEASAGSPAKLTVLRADGSEAGDYPLGEGKVQVGRESGDIFAGDQYLSPSHATFTVGQGSLKVRDDGSLNGTFKKLAKDVPVLMPIGSIFRVGQEILQVQALESRMQGEKDVDVMGSKKDGFVARLSKVVGRDTTADALLIPADGLHLGRERGDVLFPDDGYVSGLHCRLYVEDDQIKLVDLGSSNGTFVRLREETPLVTGDTILMGQQLFKITVF